MIGLGKKKTVPQEYGTQPPTAPAAMNSTPLPSWLQGEAPTPAPHRKKPRIDSGGQLVKGSMRAA